MSTFLARGRFRRDHRWAREHMSDYLDGGLAPPGPGRMERHVGVCRECRRLLADLQVILEWLHRLPAPRDGAGAVEIAASVRQRLREPPGGR